MSFVSELRRRQVFRTAAWYGGFAWFVVEVANTVFPQFGLPGWSVRAVIVAALLGLPVAMLLAWSFDLSRTGVRREDDRLPQAVAARPVAAWRSPSLWIALILGAGLAVSAQQAWQRLVLPTGSERLAIAVLPFANLSPDPVNAYFADGLHEEVLATLARAGSLRVISRTSVQQYRDTQRNLTEIADALDVDLILEGSVRRDGDELRLTLQLIDGRTDEHLWAETYDRNFQDALRLQKDVAVQVVSAIGATLSPAESKLIERSAPTVPEAYDSYLHALALQNQYAPETEQRVVLALLDRSVELDSRFAPARALRAKNRTWLVSTINPVDADALLAGARVDIEDALALQPDLPEALAARGLYRTYVQNDPKSALEDLTRALSLAPSDADSHNAAGLTLRRLGRFEEAIRHFQESARLAPGNLSYASRALETMVRTGRLEQAETEQQALVARYPASPFPRLMKYPIRFQATGETAGWREENERLKSLMTEIERTFLQQAQLTASGDYKGLAAFLESAAVEDPGDRDLMLATTYTLLGETRRAQPYLQALAAQLADEPDDFSSLSAGAIALELLGRTDEAVRAVDRAVQLRPEDLDAVNGPTVAMHRAWVLIHSGIRSDEGYRELERLIGSMDLQPRWVAASPLWRLLWDDERTQQIIRSKLLN